MIQARLQSDDAIQTAWLDSKKRIKVGDVVTLKDSDDPKRPWKVLELYGSTTKDKLHTDWHVGGL
jgi:hypothetical protein